MLSVVDWKLFLQKNGAQVTHERVETEWIVGKCARNDFYSREQAAGIGTFAVLSQGAQSFIYLLIEHVFVMQFYAQNYSNLVQQLTIAGNGIKIAKEIVLKRKQKT